MNVLVLYMNIHCTQFLLMYMYGHDSDVYTVQTLTCRETGHEWKEWLNLWEKNRCPCV